MPNDERNQLLAEYNRLKAVVQRFEEKGLHDTCHHTDLERVKAALFPKRVTRAISRTLEIEGEQEHGE